MAGSLEGRQQAPEGQHAWRCCSSAAWRRKRARCRQRGVLRVRAVPPSAAVHVCAVALKPCVFTRVWVLYSSMGTAQDRRPRHA
jgi:hypothetical protein